MDILRRDFLKCAICSGLTFAIDGFSGNVLHSEINPLKAASFFLPTTGKRVICNLCNHSCEILPGNKGRCRYRLNKDGRLYTLTYNQPVAIHIDPIEKMPMRHVLPGESVLCVGTAGCNSSCLYCINYHITQKTSKGVESFARTSGDIIRMALNLKVPAIAFTYNEPTVAYEFMYEVFSLAKNEGLKTFFHSNGFIKPEPLEVLLMVTDGVVVDLKAFDNKSYETLTGIDGNSVKETLKIIHRSDRFLEVVNLLIPGYNDSEHEIESLCQFIRGELSQDVPLHFSRFFPKYKLSHLPPTPTSIIKSALQIAKEQGLNYIYANNIIVEGNDTCCPFCRKLLVKKRGLGIPEVHIENGQCPSCNNVIPGIWG